MHQVPRGSLIAGILIAILFGSKPIHAQYSVNFQTNIISGVTSNWSGDYYVGSNTFADVLLIQSGGQLHNYLGCAGYEVGSSNNSVLVAGAGSVWNNADLYIGYSGAGNNLLVSNGGFVVEHFSSYLGYNVGSDSNNALVSGTGSKWNSVANLYLGYSGAGNRLTIAGGGQVANNFSYVGYNTSSSNNSVLVTGSGSMWRNENLLFVGDSGAGNTLVISNGGQVVCRLSGGLMIGTYVGYNTSSSNNSVLVTGSGSVWSNGLGFLFVGFGGAGNSLVISNGGQVFNGSIFRDEAYVGYNSSSSSNSVLLTGTGSAWNSRGSLHIGEQGSSNILVVDGGSVLATNVVVGFASVACDNLLQLDSGSVIVTNATTNAVLEVRRGKLVLNGGTLKVDQFVMTNACAQFIRTGGTLIYGVAVLDPNRDDDGDGMLSSWEQSHGLDPLNAADANVDSDGDGFTNLQEYLAGTDPTNTASAFRITSLVETDHDVLITWTMGSGKTNALERSAGAADGSYSNNFSTIFIVTNTVGTITNYLDFGLDSNFPSRFYRVRIVP